MRTLVCKTTNLFMHTSAKQFHDKNTSPKAKKSSKQTVQFKDQRDEGSALNHIQESIHQSSKSLVQKAKIDTISNSPVQKKENKTGLPDTLMSGIENLSGMDMSDTRVHYNSSKPAQLQAHAYAQGNQIHIAPGQEKHLPHEAWHVVQQKQGRVQPTTQLKGKTLINDDTGLEREADIMGAKALQMKTYDTNGYKKASKHSNVAQLITKEDVPEVLELLPLQYRAQYQHHVAKFNVKSSDFSTLDDRTNHNAYMTLKKIARIEGAKEKPKKSANDLFSEWSKDTAKTKLIEDADKVVQYGRNERTELAKARYEKKGKKSISTKGKEIAFSAPPFGKGKLEMISSGKSVLMFAAHGFTHSMGVSELYSNDTKKYGFMSGKYESVSRDSISKEQYVGMATELRDDAKKYKVQGVPDLVVFPHYGTDIIYEEGDFLDSLATDMDVAILIEWDWADTKEGKLMETAFVNTVPLTFVLGSKPLSSYGNYLMQVCRADWSRSAGVGGGSKRVSPKLQEW